MIFKEQSLKRKGFVTSIRYMHFLTKLLAGEQFSPSTHSRHHMCTVLVAYDHKQIFRQCFVEISMISDISYHIDRYKDVMARIGTWRELGADKYHYKNFYVILGLYNYDDTAKHTRRSQITCFYISLYHALFL